ncbi:MAG: hypothetical protein QM813_16995 [Verrucomicrobiota bacterium]
MMGSNNQDGLRITPLTLWVAGALGGALWFVMVSLQWRSLDNQAQMKDTITALVATHAYDKQKDVEQDTHLAAHDQEIRDLNGRVVTLEARRVR